MAASVESRCLSADRRGARVGAARARPPAASAAVERRRGRHLRPADAAARRTRAAGPRLPASWFPAGLPRCSSRRRRLSASRWRLISHAAPTGNGGSSAHARRRRPASATHWRTAPSCRACCRTRFTRCASTRCRRSFTSCDRSCSRARLRTEVRRTSSCSRPDHTTRPISSMPTLRGSSVFRSSRGAT